jgi:LmbE family N-acetylglucosaminyl deacetylase
LTPAPRALAFVLLVFITAAHAQQAAAPQTVTIDTKNLGVRPEVLDWDKGETGLHLLFKKLKTTGRLMMLDAHPDDEDGPTLTYLARGKGYQVLLMSLTRGEGGQNRTGSNLWDELGVLRTLELLESTRYYGTELRFSRVADFGFSKSADEAFKKWGGHEVPLRDIVYVIREWKPDVLVARFSGTPRDGHGMHQASGILAPEAIKCAADAKCFPDQLKGDHALTTWQVLKLYMGNQGGGETNVSVDVGQIDPDTKLSYFRMAMEGFRHQASQLSGTLTVPASPNWRSYKLTYSAIPDHQPKPGLKEQDFFDGIETTLSGSARRLCGCDKTSEQMQAILSAAQKAQAAINEAERLGTADSTLRVKEALDPENSPNDPAARSKAQDEWITWISSPEFRRRALQLSKVATDAALLQLQLSVRATLPSAFTFPGHSSVANAELKNLGPDQLQIRPPRVQFFDELAEPIAIVASQGEDLRPMRSHSVFTRDIQFAAPNNVLRQHWTRKDPERDTVYSISNNAIATRALPGSGFVVDATYRLGVHEGEVTSRLKAAESENTNVVVTNPVSLLFGSATVVVPRSKSEFTTVVDLRAIQNGIKAEVDLKGPDGWKVQRSLKGEQGRFEFRVIPQQDAVGRFSVSASAKVGNKTYSEGFSTVGRRDLHTFYYYQPAVQRVSIVDVNIPKSLRVGYIPGAGDDIFPVLQQLGLKAKLVSDQELASGDLHQYDTIVVGIRGYDERPEIRDNNQRLLDFVKDGGTLIVQNQKAEDVFNSGKFTPYAATLGRERVSVEEAPVEVLAPKDPIFNSPNNITASDFDGWVQERGVNFMSDWDSHFEPLLASNDPGESPLKGGMLRAKYGKGTYIYTGYAFFRQLPAGVPGAVRLYVNLLNAGHETK